MEVSPMKISVMDRKCVRDVGLIVAVWCVSVLVVNPIGDFPLVDDWSFGQTVAHLLETGEYKPLGRVGPMTLITNVLWGALFCLPAGFSFTALRFSTLAAALIGLIGLYVLIRDLQQPRPTALFVVFLIGFNPLYYVLSHSFMTDILFIALIVWSGLFFIRTLRTGSSGELLTATVLALAATLSRQLALCVPAAFAAASLLQSRISLRSTLRALAPAAVCVAVYLAIYLSGIAGQGTGERSIIRSVLDVRVLAEAVVTNVFSIAIHLGLFLFPVLLMAMRNLWLEHGRRVVPVAGSAALIMLLVAMARAHYVGEILLPLFDNWLVKSGVGMTLLRDSFILRLESLTPLPWIFWVMVTVVGLIGAVMLLTTLTVSVWKLITMYRSGKSLTDDHLVAMFALITSGLYFLLLLPLPVFYDKYVIPMMPFLAIAMVCLNGKPAEHSLDMPTLARFIPHALLVALAVFAVMGTRDFLTWNRVRWMALGELMHDRHVGPEDIDGGFEFNGLYLYDPAAIPSKGGEVSPWWVHRDTYLIAFGPLPGYSVVKEYRYQHWLPWHVQRIVVLTKE